MVAIYVANVRWRDQSSYTLSHIPSHTHTCKLLSRLPKTVNTLTLNTRSVANSPRRRLVLSSHRRYRSLPFCLYPGRRARRDCKIHPPDSTEGSIACPSQECVSPSLCTSTVYSWLLTIRAVLRVDEQRERCRPGRSLDPLRDPVAVHPRVPRALAAARAAAPTLAAKGNVSSLVALLQQAGSVADCIWRIVALSVSSCVRDAYICV